MTSPVVLINAFVVPKDMEETFLKTWNETATYMRQAPGFIDTKLHRCLDPNGKFQFINIAHWESPEAFHAALAQHEPGEKHLPIEANPALYTVEVTY